jgi:manganese-dependent ADP-ribose/CDP-alcohol diphosphatase
MPAVLRCCIHQGVLSLQNLTLVSLGPSYHFVPYNGGIGQRQLEWFRQTLQSALIALDKVIVFSHVAIGGSLPSISSSSCCLLNFEDVDHEIRSVNCAGRALSGRNTVVAVVSGHYHSGSYGCDSDGVHHLVLESPLVMRQGAWAALQLLSDRIEVLGRGAIQSRTLLVRPPCASTMPS